MNLEDFSKRLEGKDFIQLVHAARRESEEGKMVSAEQIAEVVQHLSPEERLRLISLIAESLIRKTSTTGESQDFFYGKFSGENMSTEGDFKIAEWHPTGEELNDG